MGETQAHVQRLYEGQDNTRWDDGVGVSWGEGVGVGSFLKRLMRRRREDYSHQDADATLAVKKHGFERPTNHSSQESCSRSMFRRTNRT